MAEWCRNRFEITGKSVCLDVLIQWIEGNDAPGTVMRSSRAYCCFLQAVRGY